MNFTPLNVVIIMAGIVLIYAALKDIPPRDILANTFQGKAPDGKTMPDGGKYNKKPRSNITPPGLPDYPVTSV